MNKKQKKTIVVLAILLFLSLLALIGVREYKEMSLDEEMTVLIPNNIIIPDKDDSGENEKQDAPINEEEVSDESVGDESISDESVSEEQVDDELISDEPEKEETIKEQISLSLHKNNATDNAPMYVENMFPGDRETKQYHINVSHKGTVTLRFTADIQKGYERLSEVLKMKVVLKDTNTVIYDGLMKEIPNSLKHTVEGRSTRNTQDVTYQITTYLDTSVGSAYMNQRLKADFKWWIEDTDNLTNPKIGDGLFFWSLNLSLIHI